MQSTTFRQPLRLANAVGFDIRAISGPCADEKITRRIDTAARPRSSVKDIPGKDSSRPQRRLIRPTAPYFSLTDPFYNAMIGSAGRRIRTRMRLLSVSIPQLTRVVDDMAAAQRNHAALPMEKSCTSRTSRSQDRLTTSTRGPLRTKPFRLTRFRWMTIDGATLLTGTGVTVFVPPAKIERSPKRARDRECVHSAAPTGNSVLSPPARALRRPHARQRRSRPIIGRETGPWPGRQGRGWRRSVFLDLLRVGRAPLLYLAMRFAGDPISGRLLRALFPSALHSR